MQRYTEEGIVSSYLFRIHRNINDALHPCFCCSSDDKCSFFASFNYGHFEQ